MRFQDVVRTTCKVLQDESNREGVCISGPPGTGKTAALLTVGQQLNADIVVVHPAYDEPVDYKGLPEPTGRNGERVMRWLPPDNLPLDLLLDESDRPLLWILDDIGQAHPQTQNALARTFHTAERVVAGRKLHKRVLPAATTNREEDAAAVFAMPSFARMRVTFLDLEVNAGDWCEWAYQQADVPEQFTGFVHPRNKIGGSKHIFDFDPRRRTNCSPRTLHIAGKHFLSLQGENRGLVSEWLSGILCPAFAPEFDAYLRLYEELPDVEAILSGREVSMDFCKKPDVLAVVVNALIKRAEATHLKAIGEFLLRIPANRIDFAVWLFQDARRKKELAALPTQKEIVQWAIENRAILAE